MKAIRAALIVVGCLASPAFAHPPDGEGHAAARWWTNARTGERIEGHLLATRSGKVAIETMAGEIATIPLEDLRGDDEAIVRQHVLAIRSANESRVAEALAMRSAGATSGEPDPAKPPQAAIFEAFAPFVRTRFDERWLHVESDGLPHPPLETRMMVGITAWQQQVPLPQPYVGDNAWRIPLRPELAATPISGRTSLMRGAIALAANGIPIFNALNNGGRDSFAIGELDEFGGHCGRADDYHYHAAPLFLEEVLGPGVPIAYALDGFAIYGLFDPKAKPGEPLACPLGSHEPLDELNGHFCEVNPGEGFGGGTRSYHYHSSKNFPYINGGLRGKVSIEGSGTDTQVVPQPRAVGVRPALPPLRGAKIVGFEQTAPKAWSLRYEIGGRASSVDYRLEEDGRVVFEFVGPSGERRVEEHRPPAEGEARRGRRGQQGVGPAPRDPRGGGLLERMTAFKTEVPATDFDAILASPTATAITVSVRSASDRVGAIEFGREGETSRETTEKVAMKAGVPTNFTLDGLAADCGYAYRFIWWTEEGDGPTRGEERRFHTPRAAGRAFTFVVQADSHLDQGVTPAAYAQTLANMAAARPDFLIDLGDTFMTGKRGQDFERAASQYDAQRYYFGLACDAMPLFMVLGNHDGETGGASREMAAWSYRERTSRFPPPAIDGTMFTGSTEMKDGRGANHYAFEWGDALFVVLDPFWPTTERTRGGGGRSGRDDQVPGFEDSSWSRTLGRPQYDWLARTLAASKARQKFVFVHHLVGGRGGNEARGGVESAPYFEWGGRNADGSEAFASRRPGWPMPIHALLVEHGVTAVFHGHDHLYAHAILDGIHYQCVPQPGNLGGNTRSAAEYGYASGTILGSPGHLRIAIAGDATATVEFVRTAIEGDAASGAERRRRGGAAAEANGAVVDSYKIRPRVASRGQGGAEP